MATLGVFYQTLAQLCEELRDLRLSPRPADVDWRKHRPSLDEASRQNKKCRQSTDACLGMVFAIAGQFPPSWLGEDPATSNFIKLSRGLRTIREWLYDFQSPFRGHKMPMDCDDKHQHDNPADEASWNEAEGNVRQVCAELRDYLEIKAAKRAAGEQSPPPAEPEKERRYTRASGDRLLAYSKAYVTRLETGEDLSFGLEEQITKAAIELGFPVPFERKSGDGANPRSLYLCCNDPIAKEALVFRIVDQYGSARPLSGENRASVLAALRNLIAEVN